MYKYKVTLEIEEVHILPYLYLLVNVVPPFNSLCLIKSNLDNINNWVEPGRGGRGVAWWLNVQTQSPKRVTQVRIPLGAEIYMVPLVDPL